MVRMPQPPMPYLEKPLWEWAGLWRFLRPHGAGASWTPVLVIEDGSLEKCIAAIAWFDQKMRLDGYDFERRVGEHRWT